MSVAGLLLAQPCIIPDVSFKKAIPSVPNNVSSQPMVSSGDKFPLPPGWTSVLSRSCAAMHKPKQAPLSESMKDLISPDASWSATEGNRSRYDQQGIQYDVLKVLHGRTVCAQKSNSEYYVEGKIGDEGKVKHIPLTSIDTGHERIYLPKADCGIRGGALSSAYHGTDGLSYYYENGELAPDDIDDSIKGWYRTPTTQEIQNGVVAHANDPIYLGTAIPAAILQYFN